jgi:hypothetical protein
MEDVDGKHDKKCRNKENKKNVGSRNNKGKVYS